MKSCDRTVMQKETIVKEDGRRLIYYRFVPESASDAATVTREAEDPEAPVRKEP